MDSAGTFTQIVLAEDNPADALLVREALDEHNIPHELQIIRDGELAFAFIDRLDSDTDLPCPDILLLDLHLPKRDGREILRRLRTSSRCALTPVVVLTSSDAPQDQQIGETSSSVEYFRKPSSLTEFLELGKIVKDAIARSKTDPKIEQPCK